MTRSILCAILLVAATVPIAQPARAEDARRVLEAAADALRSVRAIEYEFVSGGPENPIGWASGRARMRQVTDPSDSWLYVGGTIHAQPQFDVAEQRFEYAVDGRRAYLTDHSAGTFQSAPIGVGGNSLSVSAIYGYVTEFIEPTPLWKELDHASSARLLEPAVVDGVACDVVELTYGSETGANITIWWLGRHDHLPRRGEWRTIGSPAPPFGMSFRSITTGHPWTAGDFVLSAPAGFERRPVETAGIGRELPAVALATPDGQTVRLDELRGDVLVLDFWNTWCYICRTLTPAIADMAAEFDGDGVRFFGVNVFETGDPVAYWRERRYRHAILLEGDELAIALDLPYQPGIAVVDTEGKVVFTQLGGSPDRAQKVRRAIAAAKAAAR